MKGVGIADCGLRIADCGFMSLFNHGLKIEIESFINPQSAIRAAFSRRRLCSNIWNPLDSPSFQKGD